MVSMRAALVMTIQGRHIQCQFVLGFQKCVAIFKFFLRMVVWSALPNMDTPHPAPNPVSAGFPINDPTNADLC